MGPENNGGPMVAYIDGVGTVIGKPLSEITPDYLEGGVSTAEAAESLAAMSGVSMTMEVAVEEIQDFFHAVELASAVHLARIFEPDLARRYIHTKKKRTRKKYEKRILAWFREVFQ